MYSHQLTINRCYKDIMAPTTLLLLKITEGYVDVKVIKNFSSWKAGETKSMPSWYFAKYYRVMDDASMENVLFGR